MTWSPARKGGLRFAIAYLAACVVVGTTVLVLFPAGSTGKQTSILPYLAALLLPVAAWPAWRFAHETLGGGSGRDLLRLSAWSLLGCLPTWCLALAAILLLSWSNHGFSREALLAIMSGQTLLGVSFFFTAGLIVHAIALRIVYGVLVAVFGVMVSTTSPQARRLQREADPSMRELDTFDLEQVRRWVDRDQPIKRKEFE